MIASASTFEMMPSVLSDGVARVEKTWEPLEVKGRILRALIFGLPRSLVERLTVALINTAAEKLISSAVWFDGAREWLDSDCVPCDGQMLMTAKQVQDLVARIQEAQGPLMVMIRESEQRRAAFSPRFHKAIRHFESGSQRLLVSLSDMHGVMIAQCLREGLISESTVITLVGSPSLAKTLERIKDGARVLRENNLASTRFDPELLAEARQTLEATTSR